MEAVETMNLAVEERFAFWGVLAQLQSTPTKRFRREGWNGKGMWCSLQVPDEHSKMNRPYLYLKDVQGMLGPWIPSQTDLLAFDWMEVTDEA